MKFALISMVLLLLGAGGMVLVSEGKALLELEDKRAGFANGDGFGAERDTRDLLNAMIVGQRAKLGEIIEAHLAKQPFDPLLVGLKGEMLADQDLLASAKLLDQAQAIAPRDPRVQALRVGLQLRLQSLPFPASQLAE